MVVAVLHAGVALLVSLMRVLPASTVDVGHYINLCHPSASPSPAPPMLFNDPLCRFRSCRLELETRAYLNLGVLRYFSNIVIALSICDHLYVGVCAYCFQNRDISKPNKHKVKQISFVGLQSGNWKTIRHLKVFGKISSFSEAFQDFFLWLDWQSQLCSLLHCGSPAREMTFISIFGGGRAIFKPVEGSKILGICCICNQTNIRRRTFPKIYRRVFNEIRISLLQKHFGLQRCIFILFHSRSKSKCLEHWFNPDALVHVRTNLSPESFLSPNCRWYVELRRELCENSFCTVEKLIFTHQTLWESEKASASLCDDW